MQAEVLGTASAAFGLLESAILILGRLRKAFERQKELVAVLDKHDAELNNLKSLIQAVKDEKDLQTKAVGSELENLGVIETELVNYLDKIDTRGKGKMHQLAHQLVHGSKEEKKLAKIMEELNHGKLELFLRIQIASVGVISIVGDAVIANAETINRIDRCLRELFGEGKGLKIAKLLKDGYPQGLPLHHRPKSVHRLRSVDQDGMVSLKRADVEALGNDESSKKSKYRTGSSTHEKVRQILRNTAVGQSVMITTPVGEDVWEHMDRIEINDNSALDNSAVLAYPTGIDFAKYVLDRQERIMDKERRDRKEEREAARKESSSKS
jgi:ethanolamine utilization protein EutP (predicted NTPase)